jgi:hypothetical protein
MQAAPQRQETSWSRAVWGIAAFLWLLPLVAMQFTSEMAWSLFDFVLWAIMLAVAAGAYELAKRFWMKTAHRIFAGAAIIATFLLVWASLID